MNRINKLTLAISALVAASGGTVITANAAEVEEIIVTERLLEETLPQQLAESGHRLEMITADTIDLGGYYDLNQTLQMEVPGFYLAPKSGAFDYMNCSLQGSRCSDILWLVDGVRINNRLYANTSPLDTIPAHMVERVEVLYGGQGIFYGTQAVAGVVNIVTKRYSGDTQGSVTVGASTNEGTNINGDIGGSYGNSQFVLYGSKDEADGFQAIRDEGLQPSQTHRDRGYDVQTAGIKYALETVRITISFCSRPSS
jgi:vitamin B12 transporter